MEFVARCSRYSSRKAEEFAQMMCDYVSYTWILYI